MKSKQYNPDYLNKSFVNVEKYSRIHPRGGIFHVILSSVGLWTTAPRKMSIHQDEFIWKDNTCKNLTLISFCLSINRMKY